MGERQRMQTGKKNFSIVPYLFIAPTIILIGIFSYYAMANAIYTSFFDLRSGFQQRFTGFSNYIRLFQDRVFWAAFRNQGIMTLMAVFNSCFWPLMAAELLYFIRRKRIANIVKTAFVIPMMVPGIVTTLTWRFLFNNDYGFNTMLRQLGLIGLERNWLNNMDTALWCIILVGFPFVSGLYFLIFHSGVNNIGEEIYEAAIIEGASSRQVVFMIHIPNIVPYINVIATLSLIGSLSNFGAIAAMTNGGPGNASLTPSMQMYRVAFGDSQLGYASTMGVALLVVVLVVTLITRTFFSAREAD
jgi:ABC-type sugar transport system permease subunit